MDSTQRFRDRQRKLVRKAGKRTLRRLSDFLSRQSLVEERPVYPRSAPFPFARELERGWRAVRAEADRLLEDRDRLPAFHEISPDQYKISTSRDWRAFVLWGFGERFEPNCARCPETARLLERIPGLQSAFFSILSPRYHVPKHRGVSKGILRGHLALKVPERRERCRMRVADELVSWREGQCLVFDDTYRHEVWNDTDEERIVLLFDFDRPMRAPGRAVSRALLSGLRRSHYVRDARRNLFAWEEALERRGVVPSAPPTREHPTRPAGGPYSPRSS